MYWWVWRELGSRLGGLCPPETDPIFIVSPPRSGSSLFARLFAAHPRLVRWNGRGQLWGKDYHNPDLPTELRAQDLTDADRQRMKNVLSFFQWWYSSPVLIKQVQASLKLDASVEIFPDLKLVVLFRDGRASVESLLRTIMADPKRQQYPFGRYGRPKDFQDWCMADWLEKMCHLWRTYVHRIQEAMAQLPDHRYIQVRYEDLCKDPRTEIRRVDEHLGLNPLERDWTCIPSELPNQNWKFRKNLSPMQQAAIGQRLGDLLTELGYSNLLPQDEYSFD